ncbi:MULTISPECIES: ArnT family glycosyltransferase [Niastella]|uniref:Glycosyltransferase family 39 protein n=1 Tax=Niastella soli TaxID=2821487 RepID=A0ABS3YVH4_9BACT|nr:glycosyltransferase family 39 protein [Niastella soli]MBO9201931.1 glycosyltransferase family 39 protein [Niastella soli]
MHYFRSFFLVLLLSVVLLFIRLGAVTIFQVAEARNCEVPVEMLDRHDYLVPYFNGMLRTDKPPLHYYAMLLAYRIGGVSEASARFFSAICGVLVILATWLFARKYAGVQAAWWSSAVLLGSVHTIFQFRLATPDPYLIACHVLSLYCFWEGYHAQRKIFLWGMYALLGLAMLSKGPVGVALPLVTIVLYLLLQKEWLLKNWRRLYPITGFFITAGITIPWFYLVHIHTQGAWTEGFFIQHNINRFKDPMDGHKGPFILTWTFVIMGLFPFSIFLIRSAGWAWKQRKSSHWLFFNLVAAAVIILTYSVSATKLLNYTTPSYPFLAMIIGPFIFHAIAQKPGTKRLWPEWITLAILTVALAPAMYFWMHSEKGLQSIAPLSILLIVLPVAVLAAIYFYKQWRVQLAFNITAAGAIAVTGIFFTFLFPALDKQGSVYQMKHLVQTNRPVIAYHNFNDAFTFYHQQPIVVLNATDSIMEYLKKHPDALVLERSSAPALPESIPQLFMTASGKDLFSRQHSFIYQLKNK